MAVEQRRLWAVAEAVACAVLLRLGGGGGAVGAEGDRLASWARSRCQVQRRTAPARRRPSRSSAGKARKGAPGPRPPPGGPEGLAAPGARGAGQRQAASAVRLTARGSSPSLAQVYCARITPALHEGRQPQALPAGPTMGKAHADGLPHVPGLPHISSFTSATAPSLGARRLTHPLRPLRP